MMSKLLAFAFFGAAAASNTTTNGTTTNTVTQASSGNNVQSGQGGDDVSGSSYDGEAGSTTVDVVTKLGLTLPYTTAGIDASATTCTDATHCVTQAQVLAIANTDVDSATCTGTPADAQKVVCDYGTAIKKVLKDTVSGVTGLTVFSVADGSRRRSLTETSARRLTLATATLDFTNYVVLTAVQDGHDMKKAFATGALSATDAFKTALNAELTADQAVTSAGGVVGNVCEGTSCNAADASVTAPPTVTADATTSDAIKTGLGLAAAVVSGLFLF